MRREGCINAPVVSAMKRLHISVCCFVLFTQVTLADVSSIVSHGGLGKSPHNTSITSQAENLFSEPQCSYTAWSEWNGQCPPPLSCTSGIQIRTRVSAGNIDRCTNTTQEKTCEAECVNVLVTPSLLVLKMTNNPASGKDEAITSPLVDEERYTYGSLFACSPGCSDINGLDRDHDIVGLTCMNAHSCERAGALLLGKKGMLTIIRNKRKGNHAVKLDGYPCSCSFIPKLPLMAGLASTFYINFTVL